MKVTIFGSTTCAFCKVEKQWLESKGVEYDYRNIDEDPEAKKFIEEAGFQGVPVTIVPGSGVPIQGFNRIALAKAIGIA